MTGSCPVSARVCQETARERDELRRWKADALSVLTGLQELGKALGLPLGSRITGTEALAAVERLTRKMDEERRTADHRLVQKRRLLHERDDARAEVERLRAGIEALATAGARGIDLTPTTCGTVTPQWVYDYLATLDGAWRDHVRALIDPTEGDRIP